MHNLLQMPAESRAEFNRLKAQEAPGLALDNQDEGAVEVAIRRVDLGPYETLPPCGALRPS